MTDIEIAHLKLVGYFLEPAETGNPPNPPPSPLITAIAIGNDPPDSSNVESLIIFLDTSASACEEDGILKHATALVKPFQAPVILRAGSFEGLQAAPGDSVAPYDIYQYNIPPVVVGTFGPVAVATGGAQYVVSSNHLLANNGRTISGTKVFDPGPVSDATAGAVVATLSGYVPLTPPSWPIQDGSGVPSSGAAQVLASLPGAALSWPVASGIPNAVDCAWAELAPQPATLPPRKMALPPAPVSTGVSVTKKGRTTGTTTSTIRYRCWCGFVDYGFGTYYLVDQLGTWSAAGTDPFAAPGDSGSLAIEGASTGVGLICARGYKYDVSGNFLGYIILINRLEAVAAEMQRIQPALGTVSFYSA